MLDRLGMQLYTLRDLLTTPADIASTLKRVKQIGYAAVQVSGIGPIDPKELKKITDDLGLIICATHTTFEALRDDIGPVIEKHKLWDCHQIAVPSMPGDRSYDHYISFAEAMTQIGQKLAEAGITLSYHNHAFEFQKYNGKPGLELLYEYSNSKYVQAELDIYWIQAGGANPVAWCEKMKNRLPIVHLKDYGIIDAMPMFMEIGEGNIDMVEVLKACKSAGTQWYLVEQDSCSRPPLESAEISFRNLKKLSQSIA